jgi:hypothetical protein
MIGVWLRTYHIDAFVGHICKHLHERGGYAISGASAVAHGRKKRCPIAA